VEKLLLTSQIEYSGIVNSLVLSQT